jgi:CHASE3 domain sensor protein
MHKNKENQVMSKNKNPQEAEIVEEVANPQGKTVEELKQIAQTLQAQKNQHQEKANQHQTALNQELTMVTKAQGALEVMLQMIPKEEVEKMIVEENKSNGELVES